MIAKILKVEKYSEGAISYNETKVEKGEASLLAARNLEDDRLVTIMRTFREYEDNPLLKRQTRSRSFHMTVGPGPGEYMDKEKLLRFVDEIMERLGYADQPYVIYQHNDIEREHYHIVSTRFDMKGHKIKCNNDAQVLNKLLRELSHEYGFVVGRGEQTRRYAAVNRQRIPRFREGSANVLNSLEGLFRRALKYVFHSFSQFQFIMKVMGVKVSARKNRKGSYTLVMSGLNREGRTATKIYSASRDLGLDAWKMVEERIRESAAAYKLKIQDKRAVALKSDYCEENSHSCEEYKDMLGQLGVQAEIMRNPRTRKIERVVLVEPESDTLIDTERNELGLHYFVQKEEEGYWNSRERKKKKVFTDEEKEELLSKIDMGVGRVAPSERWQEENRQEDISEGMDIN